MGIFTTQYFDREIILTDTSAYAKGAVYEKKIYEHELIKRLYSHLEINSDTIFFDIGANTGAFTFLPLINPHIQIHAFEPNRVCFDILSENIDWNGLKSKVYLYNFGFWSEKTLLELKIPIETGLGTVSNNPLFSDYKIQVINVDTLDNFIFSNSIYPNVIKIDTEGAELEILKGGSVFLKDNNPAILLEYDSNRTSQFGYERERILETLISFGYNQFTQLSEGDLLAKK